MTNNKKDTTDLVKKVSKLCLSKKENSLFQKILEKGYRNWNEYDQEFLSLLYELHHHPVLSIGGIDIYPWEQAENIKREVESKREKAFVRLTEEPFSLWIKNLRYYK